jgi:hypothetical protein
MVFAHPHRPLGETESFRELPELGVGGHDGVDGRIEALDADVHLVRRHRHRAARALGQLEFRGVKVDVVGRRIRDRSVHAEDGNADLLARPCVARHDHAVRRTPAGDHRAAHLAVAAANLAVDPDLGVVVETHLERQRLARDTHAAHGLR